MHILATRLWHVGHGTLSSAASTALRPATAAQLAPSLLATGRRCHDLIRAHDAEHTHTGRDARRQLAAAADVLRVCYGKDGSRAGEARLRRPAARWRGRCPRRGGGSRLGAAGAHTAVHARGGRGVRGGCARRLRAGRRCAARRGRWVLGAVVAGWDNCESRVWKVSRGLVRDRANYQLCPHAALLVSKWADVVCGARPLGADLDGEEKELLHSITAVLRQEEPEPDNSGGSPLAARLLRYCAAFHEDTWVWGGESKHFVTDFSHSTVPRVEN